MNIEKAKPEDSKYDRKDEMEGIIIETERVKLRPIKIEEAEHVYNTWTSDDEVSKYMRWSTHKSVEETKQWIMLEQENCKKDNYFDWGIELKQTGKLIGSIGAHYVQELDRYEIGYVIAKKYWRQGLVTEATENMLNYLANEKGIKKFVALHAKQNPASGAVMQKVGFRYEKDETSEKFDKSVVLESKVYYLDME